MARATIKMPEEFILKLSKLGNKTDEIKSTENDNIEMQVESKQDKKQRFNKNNRRNKLSNSNTMWSDFIWC